MVDSSFLASMKDHYDVMIGLFLLALAFIWGGLRHNAVAYMKRVKVLEERQDELRELIHAKVLKNKTPLMDVDTCLGYQKKKNETVDALEATMNKIMKIIPGDTLESGIPLLTEISCSKLREGCLLSVTNTELYASLRGLKRAMIVMVMHNSLIPDKDKDILMKDLV